MKKPIVLVSILLLAATATASSLATRLRSQKLSGIEPITILRVNRQKTFRTELPAGNYSGITYIGNERYAVVDDKVPTDGFYVFKIEIDSVKGTIRHVVNEGYCSSGQSNRDMEGIAFFNRDRTVFVSGERGNRILEYTLEGQYTGRELSLPEEFSYAGTKYGLEALTYSDITNLFWTTSESTLPSDGSRASYDNKVCNRLRIQSFGADLKPANMYFYEMDTPEAKRPPSNYASGVSALCALDDGRLIVLEREFWVPKRKLGAWVTCKLYVVNPQEVQVGCLLSKKLLLRFKTRLTLLNMGLANYEGMCLGPRLADGSMVILLVSDSQNRYGGVLKDWFKTIVIRF